MEHTPIDPPGESAADPVGASMSPLTEPRFWSTLGRYAVMRNVLVAFILACALIAVLYLALDHFRDDPELPSSTAPEASPPSGVPAVITPVETQQPNLPPAPPSDGRPEVIEPPPEMMAKAQSPYDSAFSDGSMVFDSNDGSGNVTLVEHTEDYEHYIVNMGPNQFHHIYQFRLGCGHTIMTTPDPYRNVMYKYPEKLVEKYKGMMCDSCKALQTKLDSKSAKDADGEE